jgi:acetyl-CoA carboxylase, biotin carboxylase subunit
MGIKTVLVYSTADADSRPVELADEAVLIGPAPASRSYLHIPSIIHACLMTGAEAVHPGYGFLSQDPDFAEICADNGITFIGPPPSVMQAMGDKASARGLLARAGLPVPGGTDRPLTNLDDAHEQARRIGFPVMLKASAGGGGRGMRVVWDRDDLVEAFRSVRATAQAVFKDDRVYLEKFIRQGRHVEIQVLADSYGHAVALGERDCSIQRRQQKLVEEAPSTYIDDDLRQRMSAAAVAATRAIGYQSAGTLEFLVDPDLNFYFLEMNTRIQVEHPVTEMTTGLDLVELMLRVAAGEPLPLKQDDVRPSGHAMECRINAEDPTKDWRPASGTITRFVVPGGPGVRIDSHAGAGYAVPPYYDSLVAKLIVRGRDRTDALNRMRRALREFICDGVETTIPFHRQLMEHPVFRAGAHDLDFLGQYMQADGTLLTVGHESSADKAHFGQRLAAEGLAKASGCSSC